MPFSVGVLVSLSHFFKGIGATLVFTCQVGALLPSFNTPEMLTSRELHILEL